MSTKKPDYLFHYTSAITAIKKILPKMQLKMGQLSKMNDVNENLLHISNPENYVGLKNADWWDRFTKPLTDKRSQNGKVLCFSTDSNHKKGYALQRMWAQYGDTNKGVCLAIDYDKFVLENKEQFAKLGIEEDYISYSENIFNQLAQPPNENLLVLNEDGRFSLEETYLKMKSNNSFIKNNFFCKNEDWSGELEYRFLAFSERRKPIFLSFKNSLDLVILGPHFSKLHLPSIGDLVPKSKIQVLEVSKTGQLILNQAYLEDSIDFKWSRK